MICGRTRNGTLAKTCERLFVDPRCRTLKDRIEEQLERGARLGAESDLTPHGHDRAVSNLERDDVGLIPQELISQSHPLAVISGSSGYRETTSAVISKLGVSRYAWSKRKKTGQVAGMPYPIGWFGLCCCFSSEPGQ